MSFNITAPGSRPRALLVVVAVGVLAAALGLADLPGQRFIFSLFDAGQIWIADLSQRILTALKDAARPSTGRDDLARIATVASGDPAIGEIIADAIDRVGKEGVVTIEDGRGLDYETE